MGNHARRLAAGQIRVDAQHRYRLVLQIETLIAEFEAQHSDLELQIEAAEVQAKLSDPKHYAYPLLASALRTRAENLLLSIAELHSELALLKEQLPQAVPLSFGQPGSVHATVISASFEPSIPGK